MITMFSCYKYSSQTENKMLLNINQYTIYVYVNQMSKTYEVVLYLLPYSIFGSSLLITLKAVGAVNIPFTLWS